MSGEAGQYTVSQLIIYCRELIIWGADIEIQDQDGRSALSVAVTCDSEAAAKLVTLLLDNGANPNLCDRDNMTPLLIAAFEGQKIHALFGSKLAASSVYYLLSGQKIHI